MREIVLDTETTGLSPAEGHRIVEIGAVELLNHLPTGKTYHVYLNPERDMPREAEAVHGLSSAFLKDKPLFAAQAEAFLEFIQDSKLIIHNASFDMGFINAELGYTNRLAIPAAQVLDTLAMARKTHPMGPNSLDALCKRHGIDNSKRTKHGALLDAELLADVYLEMIGGKQTNLGLAENRTVTKMNITVSNTKITSRPNPLPQRLTHEDEQRHQAAIATLGDGAMWNS
jgi:DNA polymerase III subunit epsilon